MYQLVSFTALTQFFLSLEYPCFDAVLGLILTFEI